MRETIQINLFQRRKSKVIKVGNVLLGGNNPIVVQSMTTTHPKDIEKTLNEIHRLEKAGCEIVRVAVPDTLAVKALPYIKEKIKIPLVADIHFNASLGVAVLETNAIDKIRINPGNIPKLRFNPIDNKFYDNFQEIADKIREKNIPVRIGVNSGSLDKDLLTKYGYPTADALVESALRTIETLESKGIKEIVISIKSTDLKTFIEANRKIAKLCDYPLHIGVTEAGAEQYGIIKSTIGISTLLQEGIGDTIRVSLVGDPVKEVDVAYNILKALEIRFREPEIIACPTCGRINVDLEKIVKEIEEKLKSEKIVKPMKISVLGCAVNGPGEAQHADYGVAFGIKEALLYKQGKMLKKVPENQVADELIKLIKETTQ